MPIHNPTVSTFIATKLIVSVASASQIPWQQLFDVLLLMAVDDGR